MEIFRSVSEAIKQVVQLSSRIKTNADNIEDTTKDVKKLQGYVLKLAKNINSLNRELENERRNYKHLQEKHKLELKSVQEKYEFELEKSRLENQNFKTELEARLTKFENTLLKEERDRYRLDGTGAKRKSLVLGDNQNQSHAT